MSKHPLTKQLVKARLAGTEAALAKLESDYQAATYRHNPLVEDAVDAAREELEQAYESFFENDLTKSYKLLAVAWLRATFAQKMLDADAIEHLLGESDYLELTESEIPWESRVKQYIGLLEAELKNVEAAIAQAKKAV